jgi:hypothetical protein
MLDHYIQAYQALVGDLSENETLIFNTPLEDPQRLSRLLIALCLAYIWLVYLGVLCKAEGWQSIIHRKSRCDLSLFQLGFRLLDRFMNEGFSIPVQFYVII